ncbi:MAG: DUF3311 domain-containing protein [Hamadaea sp.]|nr:DUF3311 domain-containing protein [Hamadaea sp.]
MGESSPPAPRNGDRSPWNWLLIVPIAIPLIPALFNAVEPKLFGFPLFYWLQLAFILLGVLTTTLVYQMTKRRAASADAAPADGGEG